METIAVLAGLVAFGFFVVKLGREANEKANEGADKIVCPHCQTAGHVTIRMATRGKGISGGKAAGAVVTGGASIFATGLSKNVSTRHLTCRNCSMEWDVA